MHDMTFGRRAGCMYNNEGLNIHALIVHTACVVVVSILDSKQGYVKTIVNTDTPGSVMQ